MKTSDIETTRQNSPLKPTQITDILRYWQLALRYEESLNSRPKAHKVSPERDLSIDLNEPKGGQTYFKLTAQEGAGLMQKSEQQISIPLTAERAAFCEHCIRTAWFREIAFRKSKREHLATTEETSLWVLGFPVVHLPRREELAPLLRFAINLNWKEEEREWEMPPLPALRKSGTVQESAKTLRRPPDRIQLSCPEGDQGLPYSIDPQLMTRELGICDEEWSDFQKELQQNGDPTPNEMLRALCELLERGTRLSSEVHQSSLFERLHQAVQERLIGNPQSVKAYPIGIIYDDCKLQATVHVQTELGILQQNPPGKGAYGPKSPLYHYLSATPAQIHRAPFHGRSSQFPLNPEQIEAGQSFLGSRFTAVQGPPGTGKTELILNLAAARICERIHALAQGSSMESAILLLSSTNNRAVDNVLDPLGSEFDEKHLPLGLRLGNREVTSKNAVQILERCRSWIDQHRPDSLGALEEEFETKKKQYLDHFKELSEPEKERFEAQERQRRAFELDQKIAKIEENPLLEASVPDEELWAGIHRRVRGLRRQIDQLGDLACESGEEALERVELRWQKVRGRIRVAQKWLSEIEQPLEIPLPPSIRSKDPDEVLEAWEEACAQSDQYLQELQGKLALRQRGVLESAKKQTLQKERERIAEHEEKDREILSQPSSGDQNFQSERKLFEEAIELRDLWAILHRSQLETALKTAIEDLTIKNSFRRFYEDHSEQTLWILKLFPIFGCTLLSLGNALPPREGVIDELVIDEAGQCHPAYAISGLIRAHRALLIGDVHQLEPVIRLSLADEERVQRQSGLDMSPSELEPFRVYEQCGHSAQSLASLPVPKEKRSSLLEHYRCQPGIIAISDSLCDYGLRIRTKKRIAQNCADLLKSDVLMLPIYGEQQRRGGSWENRAELEAILNLLHHLEMRAVPWDQIAIITPYVGQCEAIQHMLRQAHIPCAESIDFSNPFQGSLFVQSGSVTTGTVHRFQGGERSIVLFSTVCTNRRSLLFLNERVNLVNVAVSRAKDHLIVIGHPDILQQGPITKSLLSGLPLSLNR